MEKYSIFHIEGGLGKHVAATAVAKAIKNNHPERELIIVCAWPEIFINLKFVDRVYRIGNTPYFYKDFVSGKDSILFKQEPYFTSDHIHKKKGLIKNWIELYGMKYSEETPELKFNYIQEQFGHNKWNRSAPILVLHTNGGPISEEVYSYSWTRDMPLEVSKALVDYLKSKFHIIQICRHESQVIDGVHEAHFNQMTNMELFYLLEESSARILIDSSLQHASAALGISSTVLWVGTSPKTFGYKIHNNIVANLGEDIKLPDSYLFDYNFNGIAHECPIMNISNAFNLDEIVSTLYHKNEN